MVPVFFRRGVPVFCVIYAAKNYSLFIFFFLECVGGRNIEKGKEGKQEREREREKEKKKRENERKRKGGE